MPLDLDFGLDAAGGGALPISGREEQPAAAVRNEIIVGGQHLSGTG